MSTSDVIALVALVVAMLSLLYGVVNDIRQRRDRKTVAKLNEFLLQIEKCESASLQKANISASLFRERQNDFYIIFANKGSADATNVEVACADDFNWHIFNNVFPLARLEAEATIRMKVILTFGAVQKTTIRISWANPDGTKEPRIANWYCRS